MGLSRRAFIEAQGATCRNWTWSWSFVNHVERFVIFGVWSDHEEDDEGLILGKDWATGPNGRRSPGFSEALTHVKLVSEDGYALLTFPQHAERNSEGAIPTGKARSIAGFEPLLERRFLWETDDGWHSASAGRGHSTGRRGALAATFEEGERVSIVARRVERSRGARAACLDYHGYACKVCDLSMADRYGPGADDRIHVHHLDELGLSEGARPVDPVTDLVPLCPNCHAAVHLKRPAHSLDEVRSMIRDLGAESHG